MDVREVKWDKRGTVGAGDYVYVYIKELSQHKPWFDDECLRFLDQRKQTKSSGYRIQSKAM